MTVYEMLIIKRDWAFNTLTMAMENACNIKTNLSSTNWLPWLFESHPLSSYIEHFLYKVYLTFDTNDYQVIFIFCILNDPLTFDTGYISYDYQVIFIFWILEQTSVYNFIGIDLVPCLPLDYYQFSFIVDNNIKLGPKTIVIFNRSL